MRRLFPVFCLAVALAPTGHEFARATEPFARVEVYRFLFLKFPTATRSLALGQVGTADDTHSSNQYFNPATLVTFDQAGLAFSYLDYADWPSDISLTHFDASFGATFPSEDLNFMLAGSVAHTSLDMDLPDERTVFLQGGTGKEFDAGDQHTTVALAAGVGADRIEVGLGLAVKSAEEELAGKSFDTWCFDGGALVKATFQTDADYRFVPSVGLSVLNWGGTAEYESREINVPRQLRVGVGLRIEGPPLVQTEKLFGRPARLGSVALIGDFVDPIDTNEYLGGGIELGVIDVVFLRGGLLDHLRDGEKTRISYGAGLAWTVSDFRVSFDFSEYELGSAMGDAEAYGTAITYSY